MTFEKYFYLDSIVSFALWKVSSISIDPNQIVHSARWIFIEMYFYLETVLMLPWMFSCLNFFLSRYLFNNFTDFYAFRIYALKFKIFMPHTCSIPYLSKCFRILRYKSTWETKWCGKVHLLFIENESDFFLVVSISSLFPAGFCHLYSLSLIAHVDPFEKWVFAKSSLSWKRR